ncbi:MAG TPA: DUF4147 domain-containing protein [Pyrinomonadaceae bacterium]|nr:DUF4147 domain-containing protein [Pyrinomonadaceae bacterium]
MSNLIHLRLAAREILAETLSAVDPGKAVQRVIQCKESFFSVRDLKLDVGNRPVYSIAVGKAALSMALALEDALEERFAAGLLSGPLTGDRAFGLSPRKLSPSWRWYEGGHPLPTQESLSAGAEAFELLKRANDARALVIFLISGGGSAMLEWPVSEDITLQDLRVANQTLVNCGAGISEINSVRGSFSAIKGGKLAARAPDCDQITLIVSDVPSGEERSVASGPTLAPSPEAPDADEVIARYGLRDKLPVKIVQAIERQANAFESSESRLRGHFVLLSNSTALEAAAASAQRRGFMPEFAHDISDQPIEQGCEQLRRRLEALQAKYRDSSRIVCLISGGEFACPVKGGGLGGRNLETALRLAARTNFEMVALCAGTDGIDGNSPAAGAIIDNTTIERATSIGLDPNDFLERSDAYSFFVALGDALTTGATGTNVRDVRILLARTG